MASGLILADPPRMDQETANTKPVPEGTYADLPNGYRIHYLESGQGAAVVFLHGSGSGACGYSNFKGNYPTIAAAGYRAIVPDLIGYGYSDKPDDVEYPLSFFVECVAQTLEQIGVDRYTLVGNSLGGAIAMGLALAHPERVSSLILMAPGGLNDLPDYMEMPGMAELFKVFGADEPVTEARMKDLFTNAFVVDPGCVEDQLVHERHQLMQMQNPQVIQTMQVPNLCADLHKIKCPTLALWGLDEQMMPESGIMRLARGIPDCRTVLVPRCGHWVMIEHQDYFNRACIDFLDHGTSC